MKVLIIPSWYPSPSYPNNGSFFREQAKALADAGVEVSILVIEIPYRNTKKDFKYFTKNEYIDEGIKIFRYVYPLSILHRTPKLYYCFLNWVGKAIYKKEFMKKGYQIIQAHSFFIGGYIAICLKKAFGCYCVITEHSSKILRNVLNFKEKEILKECVKKSDKFICVSQNLKSNVELITKNAGKINVYPNMVSNLFNIGEKNIPPFKYVSIGNLIPGKRMDLLLESFIATFSPKEQVILQIVGDGEEKDKLVKLIKKNKREHQIQLLGLLSRKEVSKILSKSHVMALVSDTETFGIVYVEAMASGNIVIGANNGGANDIIQKSDGIIVPQLTVNDVSKALRYVYEHYDAYNPQNISDNCLKRYSEESYTNAYLRFLTP